jgi:hypothetical protein
MADQPTPPAPPSGGSPIETSVDRLLNYVRSKGRTDLYGAAKAIGLPSDQVERIAAMLEQAGLLEMKYSLTGIHLLAREKPPAKAEEGEAAAPGAPAIGAGPGVSARPGARLWVEETRLRSEVGENARVLGFFYDDIHKRIVNAEGTLAALEREGLPKEEDVQPLAREIDTLHNELHAARQRSKLLEREERVLDRHLETYMHRVNKMKARQVYLSWKRKQARPPWRWLANLKAALRSLAKRLSLRREPPRHPLEAARHEEAHHLAEHPRREG